MGGENHGKIVFFSFFFYISFFFEGGGANIRPILLTMLLPWAVALFKWFTIIPYDVNVWLSALQLLWCCVRFIFITVSRFQCL